jgi:predicted GIY-YIG superfamily endonuclease
MYDTRQEASSEEWRVKKLSKQEKELMVEVFLSNTEYAGPHTATSP